MKHVPPYSWSDEADLLWYHGKGQTAFERSTFGGMLDRAEQFGVQYSWPQEQVLTDDGVCIGWRSAISARPTAETREHGGYMPDEEALKRAAVVSRKMMLVERRDALAASVISAYFGDLGARWAGSPTGFGRIGALFHLTVKGIKMIDAAEREANAVQLPATTRIETIAIADKIKAKEERTFALQVCAQQAVKLELEARAVWHAVNP